MSSLPTTPNPLDPGEFASLYMEHSGRVLRYLRGVLRDPVAAEDVMHEVFLKAFRALTGDAPLAPLSSWFLTVARTTAIDHVRREGRSRPVAPDVIVDIADRRPVSHREPNSHWISE